MRIFRVLLGLGFILGLSLSARSQSTTYPVRATIQLTPSYSLYLQDYVAPGSNRLSLNVFLGDLTRPELETRLRLVIEGQGIRIETKPNYRPLPIRLNGGIPQQLIAADLADYFRPENLNFQGITLTQLQRRGGALPEGLYRFRFEVLEYQRGVRISNTAESLAWLILNDPPLINRPSPNEKLVPANPQFITFQWTPRHTGSPNSAFVTEYDFELVEIWPSGRNPNDAILTSLPLYTTTTQQTAIQYGPSAPPLIPGRQYAYRVRARSVVGIDNLDLFKNDGYSQVEMFTYGDACTLPGNFSGETLTAGSLGLAWTGNTNHTQFSVRYRPANGNGSWYTEQILFEEYELAGLQPNTPYEVQLQAGCGFYFSDWSNAITLTTESLPEQLYSCGAGLDTIPFDNTDRLPSLKVGDILLAGDFEVEVTKTSGSNGTFTGKGKVLIPYFDNLQASVEYSGITVNTDYRMIRGAINVTGLAADIIEGDLEDFLDELDETLASIDDALDDISNGLDLAEDIRDQFLDIANDAFDDGPFDSTEAAELEGLTVEEYQQLANELKEEVANSALNTLVDGQTPTVEQVGEAAHQAAQAAAIQQMANQLQAINNNAQQIEEVAVTFSAGDGYAWDERPSEAYWLHYNVMYTLTNGDSTVIPVPWLATNENDAAPLYAKLESQTVPKDSVKFRGGGEDLQATWQGNQWLISLPKVAAGTQLFVAAYHASTGKTLGRVDVAGYTPQERTVHVIPVGEAIYANLDPSTIKAYLKDTYQAVFTDFTVDVADAGLVVEDYEGTLADKVPEGSRYSEMMKNVIRAYQEEDPEYEGDHFYLFVVNKSETGKSGYWPRRSQFGFVYLDGGKDLNLRTTAHELGHGAFRLQHTWERYPSVAKGTTDNLMDYGTARALHKHQWDLIQDPPTVLGFLESEEESSQITVSDLTVFEEFGNKDEYGKVASFTFIAPSGKYITIPASVTEVGFSTLDRAYLPGDFKGNLNVQIPLGSLTYFKDKNGNTFTAGFSTVNFNGYIDKNDSVYVDSYSYLVEPDKGIALFLGVNNGKYVTHISQFKGAAPNVVFDDGDYKADGDLVFRYTIIDGLGHGAFRLQHTWERYPSVAKGTTDN
ncbi:MAG: fibronectin type III domain-containing protein, partial [Bacteroidota bacterium]